MIPKYGDAEPVWCVFGAKSAFLPSERPVSPLCALGRIRFLGQELPTVQIFVQSGCSERFRNLRRVRSLETAPGTRFFDFAPFFKSRVSLSIALIFAAGVLSGLAGVVMSHLDS